jgi:hypothetical protein
LRDFAGLRRTCRTCGTSQNFTDFRRIFIKIII